MIVADEAEAFKPTAAATLTHSTKPATTAIDLSWTEAIALTA